LLLLEDLLNSEELMVSHWRYLTFKKSRSNILGSLALSRAIGDFEYKNNPSLPPEDQIVTCNPEIIEISHDEDHEFIVVACDGECS
jgi:serine/threonine protein phosphatase PrpC